MCRGSEISINVSKFRFTDASFQTDNDATKTKGKTSSSTTKDDYNLGFSFSVSDRVIYPGASQEAGKAGGVHEGHSDPQGAAV